MNKLLSRLGNQTESAAIHNRHARLRHVVDHLAHTLPAQGPIGVFIHHNTLHAFQHLPFEEAVAKAAETYGTEPYMREEAYREQMACGRILVEDIEAIIEQESDEEILPARLNRKTLRRTLLVAGLRHFDARTVRWHLDEGDLLECFRADLDTASRERLRLGADSESTAARAHYAACLQRSESKSAKSPVPARPQEGLLGKTGVDLDDVIHPLLIRLSSVYLDQGIAYWPMPMRNIGFLRAVRLLLSQPGAVYPEYLEQLGKEFRLQVENDLDAADVVAEMLGRFGVPEADWETVLQAELLALPGWAGMIRRLEEEQDLAPHVPLHCSLMEFLAVRMTLTAVAAAGVTKQMGASGLGLKGWRTPDRSVDLSSDERRAAAARLFDAAQLLGITAPEILSLDSLSMRRLRDEIEAFDDLERRRILHLAYERRHERLILLPLGQHRQDSPPAASETRPVAQVFFCIDEREESFRRHLEEIDPEMETLSAAGFYGVAVNYCGIDDAHGVSLCPVVIKPKHAVREVPMQTDGPIHNVRQARRRLWSRVARNGFVSSRTLVRGWFGTAGLGVLAFFPLAASLLAPRLYSRLRASLHKGFLPEPRTELTLLRDEADTCASIDGLLQGYTISEKINIVASVLGPAGLKDGFSRIVAILGHGSTSLNNPHESAHDCGACGGRRGAPNARLYAAMANHKDVRRGLDARGIIIPDATWFVGGYHDTCSDVVELFDLDHLPATHRGDIDRLRASLHRARALNAQERARRFEASRDEAGPDEALRHVEERSDYLAEPRPEYGHCTNAVCMVGRRSVTRGLFLDRRAFLVSYDPTLDPEDEGLARLLGAAGPVCAGISLEYYFSFVDNEGYGCGTKLPHNVTGLIGVMNGHASDLRTGLPWQMVEIHEPVRILFVIESTPERLMRVISNNPGLSELVENHWIRLATMDPDTGEIHVRRGSEFELLDASSEPLPTAATSADWYRGKLEHLPIARIGMLQAQR
jgi:uncharacterized protein YbcC (UPF0753/DUF2309 family)